MDTQRRRPPRDRLSHLHDDILGHVLSFLPAEEAGRTAILSRRWRFAFADVHTISFQQAPSDHVVRRGSNRLLHDRITAALLARRRSRGGDSQLRSFRVAMCPYEARDSSNVHRWLSYALGHGVQELQLETRRRRDFRRDMYLRGNICVIGDSDSDDSDYSSSDSSDYYSSETSDSSDSDDSSSNHKSSVAGGGGNRFLPAKLYSCASLRALHLSSCSTLQLPSTINLPSLETLALSNITYAGSGEDIQRLISSCPRLADLTLEACSGVRDINVAPETRLRSFAMRCCHSFRGITLDLSETQAFEYRGRRPEASRFTLVGSAPGRIASAKIHMCSGKIDFGKFRQFLLLFVNAGHLHLGWPELILSSQPGYDDFLADFPMFHNVTRLQLASRCLHQGALLAVAGILQRTPNLTALSLKLGGVDNSIAVPVDERERDVVAVEVPKVRVPCWRERLRELSVEQYEGGDVQRRLLRWLLRGAPAVESVRVVFAKGGFSVLDELTNQIKRWTANPAATTTFL